ncbi:Fic family protein [Xenorhabdus budapestensis]|uniref:Fic family protein n=1 Tax=Xenorhabdus budapestensis TaxID=290110 RepID=A0ABX7VMP1_XENBU|nr:Fic family protein [Xenorhabdus budapestensis]
MDEHFKRGGEITEYFIRELHSLAVDNLQREGDKTPGQYRHYGVSIEQSEHLPPDSIQVPGYMNELASFINRAGNPKYDLMKIALAHHRFGWIHPFSNGNGRTVRLLTYALLIKYGFNVQAGGRILNPTAVFYNDRNKYYEMLSKADLGTNEGLEEWCTYVLSGISTELKKVDQLTSLQFLSQKILFPAIAFSLEKGVLSDIEAKILRKAVIAGIIKAGDLKEVLPELKPAQITYQISKLVEQKLLKPISGNARSYTIDISHSYLIRGVVRSLRNEGFVSVL